MIARDRPASARERLLDAAVRLLAGRRWSQVTMAGVAKDAGVSRQTLYDTFGLRDQLARAVLLREAGHFLEAVTGELDRNRGDAGAAIEAAFGTFIEQARGNPLVRAIVIDEDPELVALIFEQGVDVLDLAATRISDALGRHWPQVGRDRARMLADNVVRLALSYAALPAGGGRDPAAEARTLLEPFVRETLAAPAPVAGPGPGAATMHLS